MNLTGKPLVFVQYIYDIKFQEKSFKNVIECTSEGQGQQAVCWEFIASSVSNMCLRYGRAGVIYEALQHQLLTREAPLLNVTLPCLLSCLKVVEFSEVKRDSYHIENR